MSGWIKLHRQTTSWEWYADAKVCRLFFHLLMTVNHKDGRYKGHDVPRGARVIGLLKLSEETGLSVQELRTASAKLKSTNNITIKSTSKFSIVTVCNYDKYQDDNCYDQQAYQQALQQTSNKPATTSKECKNKRNTLFRKSADEETLFNEFWKAYPRKKSKVDAGKAWVQIDGDSLFDKIMTGLNAAIASRDWIKEEGKYIPYPASWLRAGGWMDEVEGVKQEGQKVGGFEF